MGSRTVPLTSNIKFIFNLAGNTLINQHADINRTVSILRDESKVECIVVPITSLTPSAKIRRYLLPADNSLNAATWVCPGPERNMSCLATEWWNLRSNAGTSTGG